MRSVFNLNTPSRLLPEVLLLLAILSFAPAQAALEERASNPVALGSGCSMASNPLNPTGRSVNPAAASWATRYAATAGYARPFDLEALDQVQLNVILPFRSNVAGLNVYSFGSSLYSELAVMGNLSRRLTPWLAVGLSAGTGEISIKNYGTDRTWMADAGLVFYQPHVQLGISSVNLVATEMERYGTDPVPREGVVSLSIIPDDRLRFMTEYVATQYRTPAFRFGGELMIYQNLFLRSGFDTDTERIHLGLGFSFDGFQVDGSYDHHPWLGWTRAFGVGWGIQNRVEQGL